MDVDETNYNIDEDELVVEAVDAVWGAMCYAPALADHLYFRIQ